MKLKIVTLLPAVMFVSLFMVHDAGAQSPWRARGPWNRYHRFMGAFESDGYHRATPGPSVSYYNPYSFLNTSARNPSAFHYGHFTHGSVQYHAPPTFQYPAAVNPPRQPSLVAPQRGPTTIQPRPSIERFPAPQRRNQIQPKVPQQKSPGDASTHFHREPAVRTTNVHHRQLKSVLQINR